MWLHNSKSTFLNIMSIVHTFVPLFSFTIKWWSISFLLMLKKYKFTLFHCCADIYLSPLILGLFSIPKLPLFNLMLMDSHSCCVHVTYSHRWNTLEILWPRLMPTLVNYDLKRGNYSPKCLNKKSWKFGGFRDEK